MCSRYHGAKNTDTNEMQTKIPSSDKATGISIEPTKCRAGLRWPLWFVSFTQDFLLHSLPWHILTKVRDICVLFIIIQWPSPQVWFLSSCSAVTFVVCIVCTSFPISGWDCGGVCRDGEIYGLLFHLVLCKQHFLIIAIWWGSSNLSTSSFGFHF